MIIIEIKDDDSIERALKVYKRKHRDVGIIKEIRKRQHFTKKSVARRNQLINAEYRKKKFDN